jgi:hypothetical protein
LNARVIFNVGFFTLCASSKVPVEGAIDSKDADAGASSQVEVEDRVKLLTPSEIITLKH